jgi:hypothetical protein
VSGASPDIPLTILQLSFSAVKGNLNLGSRADVGAGPPEMTLRSMTAFTAKARTGNKNFAAFRS